MQSSLNEKQNKTKQYFEAFAEACLDFAVISCEHKSPFNTIIEFNLNRWEDE